MEDKKYLPVTSVVKAVNEDQHEVLHMITNGATDRAGDVVDPAGAEIANYMKNPVVLANHDYSIENVIGKAVGIEVQEDAIYARTKFLETPLAQTAFNLAKEGIGGWSIGFRPIEHEAMKDGKGQFKGFKHDRWELLEYSSVAIPMNQDVVNNAIHRGLMTEEQVPAFFVTDPVDTVKPAAAADLGPTVERETGQLIDVAPLRRKIANALITLDRAKASIELQRITGGMPNGRPERDS